MAILMLVLGLTAIDHRDGEVLGRPIYNASHDADQSYVAQARSTEVAARNIYAKARAALQRATGSIVEANGITVAEAIRGKVTR